MNYPLYQIDAFTIKPFTGNPAAVCVLTAPVEDAWLQSVALEMNLSETAFLRKVSSTQASSPAEDCFSLRWFTPKKEVRLCGHATLASAHILWETGMLPLECPARFDTLSGRLTATRRDDWIDMDFPARLQQPVDPPDGLLDCLGIKPLFVGKTENNVYMIEVAGEAAVRQLQPEFTRLGQLPVRSVIVTTRSESPEFDIVSRYFAPAVGVNEDPVTGSAHCVLTPYWAERLKKTSLRAYQASARGGILHTRLEGDRVILSGQAITVLKGTLSA